MKKNNHWRAACLSGLVAVCGSVLAAPPDLGFPVKCTLGTDCWVVNYMDSDPAEGSAVDHQCGHLTYDAHKGTDIAVRDWVTMEKGVEVTAAAAGTVIRVRDGETDEARTPEQLDEVQKSGRECGNGVLIGHGEGWQTMYCHMKQGSIAVQRGQAVMPGEKLGLVGHSGFVEFPHLHIGVLYHKKPLDPFTGQEAKGKCDLPGTPLWRKDAGLGYVPGSIYAAGFDDAVPDFEAIKHDAGGLQQMRPDAGALTFWVAMFGVSKGDRIRLEIRDPAGRVFSAQDIVQERDRARQFYYVGEKLEKGDLLPGTYVGKVRLSGKSIAGAAFEREAPRELAVSSE